VFPDLFVFDMIGTTVESSDAIPEAFLSAFAAVNIELTADQLTNIRGKSKREAIAEILTASLGDSVSNDLQSRVYEAFRESLVTHYRDGNTRPIRGARETFDWCHSSGASVALTTGFDRNVAGILIEQLGWEELLDALVCNDDVSQGRPAPQLIHEAMERTGISAARHVASIGDTTSDLEAGANAGVGWNIAVLTGAHTKARLSGIDGAILLDGVTDLQEYAW
jgi:phosphonatase-like hydrolase